jgi:TPP-dependent pyruvate/acetoin dehydrogenase alpha subunit
MDGMTNDPMAYITAGEVASKVESDPVPRFREWLIAQGHATGGRADDDRRGMCRPIFMNASRGGVTLKVI